MFDSIPRLHSFVSGAYEKTLRALSEVRVGFRYGPKPDEPFRYLFSHIPKCAGTSCRIALQQWFVVVQDYGPPWADAEQLAKMKASRPKYQRLTSRHLIAGHFHVPGIYLHERYPEALSNQEIRVFTFIRDPLQLLLSLYYFEKTHGMLNTDVKVEDRIFRSRNWLANRFPCTMENYRETIDRYFFVGVVEELDESMEVLRRKLNKRPVRLRRLNISKRDHQQLISDETRARFRRVNELDYCVYDYCMEKFQKEKIALVDG